MSQTTITEQDKDPEYHGETSKNLGEIQLPETKLYKGKSSDPFGEEDGGTKYRTMEWWQCGMIMIAETVSLGILSLPAVLAAIGFAPGMILIFGLGLIATYTGYVLGQFKLRYPHVHNMADVGEVLLGPIGREVFGAAQLLYLVFVCGSHTLTFSIMMNTLTNHGACTILFGFLGAAIPFLLSLPRTLNKVSYMSVVSFVSITAAVTIVMVGVGVERLDTAVYATVKTEFASAFLATTNVIFGYGGHVAFFGFMSEMKKPEDYKKSLILLQVSDTTLYLIVAAIVYAYAGENVTSPALGSASPIVAKVAFGIAIPTIVVSGVVIGHVAAKYVYVRLYRGTSFMSERSVKSYGVWALIVLSIWIVAFIIAQAIPVFSDLLGLISSIFASWFTYGLSGTLWLFLNVNLYSRNWKKMSLTGLNLIIFIMGCAICGIGLYASGKSIHDDEGKRRAFSCADNSS